MIYFHFFSPQSLVWQSWWATTGWTWFSFFFTAHFHTFTAWIRLLPVVIWSPCRIIQQGTNQWKLKMGCMAFELFRKKYTVYSHVARVQSKSLGQLRNQACWCIGRVFFYEYKINATGVPFPFSPTSPLWFSVATALEHRQKKASSLSWIFHYYKS